MYTLLVADDEAIERDAIRHIIHQNCPDIERVIEAANGREVLERCDESEPDIVFLDIRMPGLNGLETGRELRRRFPGIHLIILTAYDFFDYAREAIKIGVDDFIVKPASVERVIEVVVKVVALMDKQHELRELVSDNIRKLEKFRDLFRSELVALIMEHEMNEHELICFLSAAEVSDGKGCVAAARVDYEAFPLVHETTLQRDLLRRRCLLRLQSELDGRPFRIMMHVRDDDLYFLVFPDLNGEGPAGLGEVFELFQSIVGAVRRDFAIGIKAAVGPDFSSLTGARPALMRANNALNGRRDEEDVFLTSAIEEDRSEMRNLNPRMELLMEQVVERIRKEYMQSISLDEAASWIQLSSFYFSKIFRQYRGSTFIDFLNETRLIRARELLADPVINIKEIAFKVGFSDPNYFARVFKRVAGITPSEFREKLFRRNRTK